MYPGLVKMWSPNNKQAANKVFYNSSLWFKWVCPKCSGEYGAFIKDVVEKPDPCPYCNDRQVLPRFNSLAVRHPEIATLWVESNERPPSEILPSLKIFANWLCPVCHGEYKALVADMVSGIADCPYCNDRQVLLGFNSFKARHKDLMDEWDDLSNYLLADPDQIGDSCIIPVWWNCPHDQEHHYMMSPKQRLLFQKRQQEPCLYCKGRRRKKHHFI